MIVIGLTGSIGMGKTTVCNMMREAGIPVHDADAAVHYLLGAGGDAVETVAQKFPAALAVNEQGQRFIDRQALGRIVFADRAKKKELEDILHPLVRAQSDAFVAEMGKRAHQLCVLDIPLLFETNGEKRVDVTVCVSAPPETQRERVLARHGMTSEKFDRIVAGQMPDTEKRKRADYVIENDADLETTRLHMNRVLDAIRLNGKRAGAINRP
jgi:dephospho-CoA kinase